MGKSSFLQDFKAFAMKSTFFHFPLYQVTYQADGEEESGSSCRSSRTRQGRGVADGDSQGRRSIILTPLQYSQGYVVDV